MPDGAWWARFISPDHLLGRTLMGARTRLELVRWRTSTDRERALKRAIARLSPAHTMIAVDRLRQLAAHAFALKCEFVSRFSGQTGLGERRRNLRFGGFELPAVYETCNRIRIGKNSGCEHDNECSPHH